MKGLSILAFCSLSLFSVSCGLMRTHSNPVGDTYRNFSRTYGVTRSPKAVSDWLDVDTDFGKICIAGKIALFGVCKDTNASRRKSYAELYLKIFNKISNREFGCLSDVDFEDDVGLHYHRNKTKKMVSLITISIIRDFDGINAEAHGSGARRNSELIWLHKELEKLYAFKNRVPW